MKYFIIGIFSLSVFLISCEDIDSILNFALTDEEIVGGLKEALDVGLDASVQSASSVDGYLKNEAIKLLLPEEVQTLKNEIETGSINLGIANVPYSTLFDTYIALNPNVTTDPFEELLVAMNRGAESAATKAVPIFTSAIVNMSFSDALGILQGGETSATDYFFNATSTNLATAFQPDIKGALDETQATEVYSTLVGFQNYEHEVGFGTVKPSEFLNFTLPNSIEEYATEKAVGGLFHLIGEEEKKIRENPLDYSSAIIQKVFNSVEAQ